MQDFQESESIDLMLVMMMMMTTDFRLVTRIESQAIVSVTVCHGVRHWAVSVSRSLSLWQSRWLLTPVGRTAADGGGDSPNSSSALPIFSSFQVYFRL